MINPPKTQLTRSPVEYTTMDCTIIIHVILVILNGIIIYVHCEKVSQMEIKSNYKKRLTLCMRCAIKLRSKYNNK